MWPESASVLQLAIGLLFLQSSVGKLIAPAAFVSGIRHYRLLPNILTVPAAATLIGAEAVISLSHLTGWMLFPVLIIATGLLLVFLAIAVFTLRRRKHVPCLCFGVGDTQLLSWQSVARLALLISVEAAMLSGTAMGTDWPMPHEMDSQSLSTAIASAVLLVVTSAWLLNTPELVTLARRCRSCSSHPSAQP